jgi:hypothetical protein
MKTYHQLFLFEQIEFEYRGDSILADSWMNLDSMIPEVLDFLIPTERQDLKPWAIDT